MMQDERCDSVSSKTDVEQPATQSLRGGLLPFRGACRVRDFGYGAGASVEKVELILNPTGSISM
jgi:hypothetical protein